MNSIKRLLDEFRTLSHILDTKDLIAFTFALIGNTHEVLVSRNLASVDAAMSRQIVAHYRNCGIAFPLDGMDRILAAYDDSPSFGGVREIYAHDCYLKYLNISGPVDNVLDLGANRGMFSLLALSVLDARLVIGVEPSRKYDSVVELLLGANNINPDRVVRYHGFITSPRSEQMDPAKNISIETVCKQQGIERIALAKIDIEGFEKDLFSEPNWLTRVDNIAMELHGRFVGDLSLIPRVLTDYGFEHRSTGISGESCDVNQAMYLYASRTGSLAPFEELRRNRHTH